LVIPYKERGKSVETFQNGISRHTSLTISVNAFALSIGNLEEMAVIVIAATTLPPESVTGMPMPEIPSRISPSFKA
jgi:hypothetical protein